jgi:integrase
MNCVESIPTANTREKVLKMLSERHSKYEVMFCLGIETGLRIGDILRIRVCDVVGGRLAVKEQKTGKFKAVVLSLSLMSIIGSHVKCYALRDDHYLVYSRDWLPYRSLSRQQAWRVMREAGKMANLKQIGTHTMRKTFAADVMRETGDISLVQRRLSHENMTTTLGYLCGPRVLAEFVEQYIRDT